MSGEPTFFLSRTIGGNAYEIEGYLDGPMLRLKIVREFSSPEKKLERTVQSVVFPVEIFKAINLELIAGGKVKPKDAKLSANIDQLNTFIDENIKTIKLLCMSREEASGVIAEAVEIDEIGVARVDAEVASLFRTLAVLHMVDKVR